MTQLSLGLKSDTFGLKLSPRELSPLGKEQKGRNPYVGADVIFLQAQGDRLLCGWLVREEGLAL